MCMNSSFSNPIIGTLTEWFMHCLLFFFSFVISQWWEKINSETDGFHVGQTTDLPGAWWKHGRIWWASRDHVQCTSQQQLS